MTESTTNQRTTTTTTTITATTTTPTTICKEPSLGFPIPRHVSQVPPTPVCQFCRVYNLPPGTLARLSLRSGGDLSLCVYCCSHCGCFAHFCGALHSSEKPPKTRLLDVVIQRIHGVCVFIAAAHRIQTRCVLSVARVGLCVAVVSSLCVCWHSHCGAFWLRGCI